MYSHAADSSALKDSSTDVYPGLLTLPNFSSLFDTPLTLEDTPKQDEALTPSATIRLRYYKSLSIAEQAGEKQETQHDGWQMNSYYAPLNAPSDSLNSIASSDAESLMSVRSKVALAPGNSSIYTAKRRPSRIKRMFRSKNRFLQNAMVKDGNENDMDKPSLVDTKATRLLSKLTRSTAPMLTKLSSVSPNGSNTPTEAPRATAAPVKKSSESIISISTASRKLKLWPKDRRSQSFSFVSLSKPRTTASPIPKSLIDATLPPSIVQPALLSKVALVFTQWVMLGTRSKDSIEYKDVFDGREAVDKLAQIINTSDRQVALLLGRALESQKLFHDVRYEHRLRDSPSELYQFHHISVVRQPFLTKTEVNENGKRSFSPSAADHDNYHLPNGVFTSLTACYSPTCTRDNVCYSALCPRRTEQTARINLQGKSSHHRKNSGSSLNEKCEDRLWILSVPKHVSDSLSANEKKRQEHIFELIYTERDFVNDLAYLRKFWIEPLLENDCIPQDRRQQFVEDVFWNINQVYETNKKLSEALDQRAQQNYVVDQIGDIILCYVASFTPFVDYGAHQIIGKYVFETEKLQNPEFAKFVKQTEHLAQSRKLELNGYLTKPTTRLGRYNLLLREILKHTPEGHPDKELIPCAMNVISECLNNVNDETGKTENKFHLRLLADKLVTQSPQDLMDLKLEAEHRKIIMKGTLKRKGSRQSEYADLQVYLLDHCLLLIKPKVAHHAEFYKIYKKPIPLPLLSVTLPDVMKRSTSALPYGRLGTAGGSMTSLISTDPLAMNKAGYPITISSLGRFGNQPITLYAPTQLIRRQWHDAIQSQHRALMAEQTAFSLQPVVTNVFNSTNRVSSVTTFGHAIVLGADQGVFLKKDHDSKETVQVLGIEKVSQLEVLENFDLMLVLADKVLYSYTLDSLFAADPVKRGRKLSRHVSFFKVGTALAGSPGEKTLVSFARHNAMSTTIQVLEPHASTEKKHRSRLTRWLQGSNESLKVYKSLYVPEEATSIQYFKHIICVGSAKGFQMVDLASTDVQSVLDPDDERHQALLQRQDLKPMSMLRHPNGQILLCYNEIAIYIDKKGRRARTDWVIHWEGQPTAFAWKYPYIIAFDPTFIEIRHADTGNLVQVIPGKNIRCLSPESSTTTYCVMEDPVGGAEVVYELTALESSA